MNMRCEGLNYGWRRFDLCFPAGSERDELYALLDRLNIGRRELALIVLGLRVHPGFKLKDFGGEGFERPFVFATLNERDAELERLWAEFGDVPMNPETECMEAPFLGFPAGAHREEIWHWFDERHSKGVSYLLNGEPAR